MAQRQTDLENFPPKFSGFSAQYDQNLVNINFLPNSSYNHSIINSTESIVDQHDSSSPFLNDRRARQRTIPSETSSTISPPTAREYDCSKRTLIIVPGYSVNIPPRIGHHLYYINALKYDPQNNPRGYRRIHLFDIYSKKAGRCNFKATIPQLADDLWQAINSPQNDWSFEVDGEVDFIGGSMGGLIIRQLIRNHLQGKNELLTKKWGTLHVNTILLIGTPNFGCKLVDRLQSPLIQLILRLWQGKNNFSTSQQLQQVRVGNEPVFGKLLRKLFNKKTPKNCFLADLNQADLTPGDIRWITVSGSKRTWSSFLLFSRGTENDGVVASSQVHLPGAENIHDYDLGPAVSWDHRDLYENPQFCQLLRGLLVHGLTLDDYVQNDQLALSRKTNQLPRGDQRLSRKISYKSTTTIR
ncbi:MAG: hypothetical protein GF308_13080 [Candidatus Heimdallarchaeota archaeon]|nr:hypothetical protein [Candidatus Heimdallarchaeota archaeon]